MSRPATAWPQTGADVAIPSEDSVRVLAHNRFRYPTGIRQVDSMHVEDFVAGYFDGCHAAIADIQHRRPRICTMGLNAPEGMDDTTGFFREAIAGCLTTAALHGYQEGYNGIVETWLDNDGLPDWSRRKWVAELKSPREFFQSHAHVSGVTRIETVGTLAISPDRLWFIRVCDSLSPYDSRDKPVNHLRFVQIVDSTGDFWESERLWLGDAYASEIVWGETGSDAVGIHWWASTLRPFHSDSTHWEEYLTLDLRSGRIIAVDQVRR